MKYSVPKNIEHTYDCDGILYFLQRTEEMLFEYSIDLYRVPLLNTHSLAMEYCDIAKKVSSKEVKEYQREIVFEEFRASFSSDMVIKECWGKTYVDRIIKMFGSCSEQERYRTVSYINSLLNNRKYYDWCTSTIKKYVSIPKEKKKLELAIRSWLPELISVGYSTDYIYNQLRHMLDASIQIDEKAIDSFLSTFDFAIKEYKVYFSVSSIATKYKDILEKRLRLFFNDDGNFSKFKKDNNKVIVHFDTIKAICPNGAAQLAYDRIDLFFSFYRFVGNKRSFAVQSKAMVIDNESNTYYVPAQKMAYNIIEENDFTAIGQASDSLLTGLLINAESEYHLLRKSIELHNTALAISDFKSGFLNLWASVELLCQSSDDRNKLSDVINKVIPILKKDYFAVIIENIITSLNENLSSNEYNQILELVSDKGCENKKMFYLLMLPRYKKQREEVINKLINYPVLRSRIHSLGELNRTDKIKAFLEKYVQRVTWHLYRMYRTRNAIIHSGEIPNNIKILGENLHSYVDATIYEYVVKLSGDIPFISVDNVDIDIRFAVNNIERIIEMEKEVDEEIVDIFIHPEIDKIMNCEEHKDAKENAE